jgi:cation diffusion facilitator family transporter
VRVHVEDENARVRSGSAAGMDHSIAISLTADSADRHPKLQALLSELDGYVIPQEQVQQASKKAKGYYEASNELVDGYREVVALLDGGSTDDEHATHAKEKGQAKAISRLLSIAFKITLVMLCLKMFSAVWSGSIAVIASAVDSVLDVVSQGGLVLAERFMRRKDPIKYPIGKSRLESLAVMSFGGIMMMAAVILLQQSAEVLQTGLSGETSPSINFDTVAIIVMAVTIVTQVAVLAVCKRIMSTSDEHTPNIGSVDALAQDNMNDIVVNTLSATAAAIATADHTVWFLDPIIGLVVSLYMLFRWAGTVREQFLSMLGHSADGAFLSKLTYLAMIHDDRIMKVDTVIGYQLGTKHHCEVHVVLPADMPLRVAHDIGEALEKNIEKMDGVELAWVHLDFEWQHRAEHNRSFL